MIEDFRMIHPTILANHPRIQDDEGPFQLLFFAKKVVYHPRNHPTNHPVVILGGRPTAAFEARLVFDISIQGLRPIVYQHKSM